ncbi:hypothetical protein HDU82_002022 [Entophlyctis luteolus]|nr:hypothetical protein HDU82_002022 [Entophlyctis luteolus]
MDVLHQALQLAASTPIPYVKEIASLGLAIWTTCDQRRANSAALHALRDKVALVVVTLERKCQTEGTTVTASEHLPQLRYWLEEMSEWIAKQAARGALVQVARANVVRDKAGLYADKLAFYIQVFQLAAVPWTGQGADRDLQPVLEKILRVATADIVASIERDLDGMREELVALMEHNTKETVDVVLGRLDIVNSNMIDSVLWATPADVLRRAARSSVTANSGRDIALMPPQYVILRELLNLSLNDVRVRIAADPGAIRPTASRPCQPVPLLCPEDGSVLLFPGDYQYPDSLLNTSDTPTSPSSRNDKQKNRIKLSKDPVDGLFNYEIVVSAGNDAMGAVAPEKHSSRL